MTSKPEPGTLGTSEGRSNTNGSEPYTPSVEEGREVFALSGEGLDFKHVYFERRAAFDRMLAQVRREAAAEALRDAAEDCMSSRRVSADYLPFRPLRKNIAFWLTARAAALETGEPE